MRITNTIAKLVTGAALAAALLVITPSKAQAQVGFQVGIGTYGAPVYNTYGPVVPYGGWHHDHWDGYNRGYDWQAQRAAEWRHQEWERSHFDHRGGYGWNGGDRGRYGYHEGGRY